MHNDDALVDEAAAQTRQIDRRTIAKGVAWTVPVVIVATAAPAAAASGSTSGTFTATHVGQSANYKFVLTVDNSTTSDVVVELQTLTKSGSSTNLITANATSVKAGKSTNITVYTGPAAAGETYTLMYMLSGTQKQQSVVLS